MLPAVLPQHSRTDPVLCRKWIDNDPGKGGVQETGRDNHLKDEVIHSLSWY